MLTFEKLLRLAPELSTWRDDARSIARHAKWDWFPRWLPGFRDLRRDVGDLARRHDLPFDEIHRLAVAELVSIYETERRRQQRRRAKGG